MIENNQDNLRVHHILDAIATIDRHLLGISREDFLRNELLINLVSMQIAIIGEAIDNLSEDFQRSHPHLPYRDAKDMRNYIIHEYFGISSDILWKTVQNDLPNLKLVLSKIQQAD